MGKWCSTICARIVFTLTRRVVASKGIHLFWLRGRLEDGRERASPGRPGCDLAPVGIDGIPVMLTAAGVEVDLVEFDPALALPDVSDNPKEEDDREGEIGLEKAFGVIEIAGEWRSDGNEKLRCQCDED